MLDLYNEDLITEQSPQTIEELCERIRAYFGPQADLSLIEKAYHFSEKAHTGQIRRSGEPYITHPLGVAAILADLHLDLASIATGLLHDTVEDTTATLADIEREFGKNIAELVDGVTKISKMNFRNTHEKQGENIRKMIIAMGKDVRVVLVKLADRLHNMRSLGHMPPEKQSRIAQETLDIYSPLAGRLGIMSLKVELEDLSFRYSKPDNYYQLAEKVAMKRKERERYIEDVKKTLVTELSARTKANFEVWGRPKHLYSIYKKMQARNLDYEQIYDVLAFRALVGSVSECYEVLGHVHALWKPIPGRFKDFIAMPKVNKYQSLHTTVIGPGGERIEIQIRTRDMHATAERGIAAHWKYKEAGRSSVNDDADGGEGKFEWLRDLVQLHQQVGSSDEFLETVKNDLWEREIYVFTPRGDVRELPDGSTPIDFAYAVHTDVGTHCAAARVNGRLVPLKTKLKSGDTIEVITSAHQQPSKDWLKFCVTPRAKNKIRWFVKNEQRKRALELGKEILEKDFRKFGHSIAKAFKDSPEMRDNLRALGAAEVDDLYVAVGYGKYVGKDVVEKFFPNAKPVEEEKKQTFLQKVFQNAATKSRKSKSIIKVDGLEDMLIRFGKCCNPIPGDPIAGFITRGRGITIHKSDCERAFEVDTERRIDVEWTVDSVPDGLERVVRLRVISHDVPGLLKHMSEAFTTRGINIHNAQIRTTKDKKAICIFDVSVRDTSQLSQVMQDLSKINGIIGVTRVTHV